MNTPRDPAPERAARAAHAQPDAVDPPHDLGARAARDGTDDIDPALAGSLRAALDEPTHAFDAPVRERLAQARRAAVAAASPAARWRSLAWPAAALSASLALWMGVRPSTPALPAPAPSTDVADYAHALVVATDDEAAAIDEDLEFYAWLDAQSQGG